MLLYCDTVISHELELDVVYIVSDGPMLIALVTVDFLDSDSQDVCSQSNTELASHIQSYIINLKY